MNKIIAVLMGFSAHWLLAMDCDHIPILLPITATIEHTITDNLGHQEFQQGLLILDNDFMYYRVDDTLELQFDGKQFIQFDHELNHATVYDKGLDQHPFYQILMGETLPKSIECLKRKDETYSLRVQMNDESTTIVAKIKKNAPRWMRYKDSFQDKHNIKFSNVNHDNIDRKKWSVHTRTNTTFSRSTDETTA